MIDLEERIKARAQSLGFDLVGITSADPPEDYGKYLQWLEKGYSAKLWYLQEKERREKRGDLRKILPGARSVISVAMNYAPHQDYTQQKIKFARYGWGRDYHKVLRGKLLKLGRWVEEQAPSVSEWKPYVDTGPVLERSLAQRAGLGWIGKNTLVLEKNLGSYLVLGEILTTLSLRPDQPARNHCGECTACLDACPTDAFPGPYELDATRCISYHTLESPDDNIPEEIAQNQSGWVAGCDICQEVCPWNRKAPAHRQEDFVPRDFLKISNPEIEKMAEKDFRKRFEGTAFLRMGLKRLRRNLRTALRPYRQEGGRDKG